MSTANGPACINMKMITQKMTKFLTQQILGQPQATHLDLCFGIGASGGGIRRSTYNWHIGLHEK